MRTLELPSLDFSNAGGQARRHPQLVEEDVKSAFNSIFRCARRGFGECTGMGVDGKQRLVELVFRECEDCIAV